jgi:hypothetical protein
MQWSMAMLLMASPVANETHLGLQVSPDCGPSRGLGTPIKSIKRLAGWRVQPHETA